MPQASLPHVLLEHRPSRLVLRLAFPSMAAMLASSLASLTDALFLSRVSSSLASAAAYCLPLISLIQTVGFTLGMGAGSFVSRRLTDRDTNRSESAASTALAAALALGALICLLGQLFPSSLLRLLGAQKNDLPAMIAYVRFLLAGAPITCASLVLSSLLPPSTLPTSTPDDRERPGRGTRHRLQSRHVALRIYAPRADNGNRRYAHAARRGTRSSNNKRCICDGAYRPRDNIRRRKSRPRTAQTDELSSLPALLLRRKLRARYDPRW